MTAAACHHEKQNKISSSNKITPDNGTTNKLLNKNNTAIDENDKLQVVVVKICADKLTAAKLPNPS